MIHKLNSRRPDDNIIEIFQLKSNATHLLFGRPHDTLAQLCKWHNQSFHLPIVVLDITHYDISDEKFTEISRLWTFGDCMTSLSHFPAECSTLFHSVLQPLLYTYILHASLSLPTHQCRIRYTFLAVATATEDKYLLKWTEFSEKHEKYMNIHKLCSNVAYRKISLHNVRYIVMLCVRSHSIPAERMWCD